MNFFGLNAELLGLLGLLGAERTTVGASRGPGCPGRTACLGSPAPAGSWRRRGSHALRRARPLADERRTRVLLTSLTKANSAKYCISCEVLHLQRVHSTASGLSGSYRLRKQASRLDRDRNCPAVIWLPIWLTCEDTRGLWLVQDIVRFARILGSKAPCAQILSVAGPGDPRHAPSPPGVR